LALPGQQEHFGSNPAQRFMVLGAQVAMPYGPYGSMPETSPKNRKGWMQVGTASFTIIEKERLSFLSRSQTQP